MGSKAKSGGGRKIGKQKKKASQARYSGETRWRKNQQKKMRKHFKRTGSQDGQAFSILHSKFGTPAIAGLVDPRPGQSERLEKFTQIRSAAELRRKPVPQPRVLGEVG